MHTYFINKTLCTTKPIVPRGKLYCTKFHDKKRVIKLFFHLYDCLHGILKKTKKEFLFIYFFTNSWVQ